MNPETRRKFERLTTRVTLSAPAIMLASFSQPRLRPKIADYSRSDLLWMRAARTCHDAQTSRAHDRRPDQNPRWHILFLRVSLPYASRPSEPGYERAISRNLRLCEASATISETGPSIESRTHAPK